MCIRDRVRIDYNLVGVEFYFHTVSSVSSLAIPGVTLSKASSISLISTMMRCGNTRDKSPGTASFKVGIKSVSYTHLDVYKRQVPDAGQAVHQIIVFYRL